MRKQFIVEDNNSRLGKKLQFNIGNTDYWLPILIEFLILLVSFFSLRETLHFLYGDDDLVTSLLRGASFLNGVTVSNFLDYTYHQLIQEMSSRILIGSFFINLL